MSDTTELDIERKLQRFFPIYFSKEHDRWLVLGYDAARRLLRSGALRKHESREASFDRFEGDSLGRFHEHNVLFADPPKHSRLRKVMRALYPMEDVARVSADIEDIARRLCDRLPTDGGVADLFVEYARSIPVEVICSLIGLDEDELPLFAEWSLIAATSGEPDAPLRDAVAAEDIAKRASVRVEELLASDDLVEGSFLRSLQTAIADGDISGEEACSLILMSFSGGHETTATLIGACVASLAEDQELQDRLRSEPELIAPFADEMVRLTSPIQYTEYAVAKTQDFDGVHLEEGQRVAVLFGVANRDRRQFSQPDEVKLQRDEDHIAYGSGRHVCPGGPLAAEEAEIALRVLLASRRFRPHGDGLQWADRVFIPRPLSLACVVERLPAEERRAAPE